jgi:hypothetical protein
VENVEVRYAGVGIGRSTHLRDWSEAGAFVGFAEPMPTGTPLVLKGDGIEQPARVVQSIESADVSVAGMRVEFTSPAQTAPAKPAAATPAAATPAGPIAPAAPVVPVAESEPVAAAPTENAAPGEPLQVGGSPQTTEAADAGDAGPPESSNAAAAPSPNDGDAGTGGSGKRRRRRR